MAAAAAAALHPWAGDANQWRIVWHFPDEEADVLIVNRFRNAWATAQPPAPDDEPGWTYTHRMNVWGNLLAGQTVRIAWRADDGSFVTLQRL